MSPWNQLGFKYKRSPNKSNDKVSSPWTSFGNANFVIFLVGAFSRKIFIKGEKSYRHFFGTKICAVVWVSLGFVLF